MVHKSDEGRTCSRSRWCKQNTKVILFYLMGVTKDYFFKDSWTLLVSCYIYIYIGNLYGIMCCSLPSYIKNEHL